MQEVVLTMMYVLCNRHSENNMEHEHTRSIIERITVNIHHQKASGEKLIIVIFIPSKDSCILMFFSCVCQNPFDKLSVSIIAGNEKNFFTIGADRTTVQLQHAADLAADSGTSYPVRINQT